MIYIILYLNLCYNSDNFLCSQLNCITLFHLEISTTYSSIYQPLIVQVVTHVDCCTAVMLVCAVVLAGVLCVRFYPEIL